MNILSHIMEMLCTPLMFSFAEEGAGGGGGTGEGAGGGGTGEGAGGTGGGGGTAAVTITPELFRESIPEEIRGDPSLKDINDVGSMATQLINAQKLIGTDKIAKPLESWTPEQWTEFHGLAGRPAEAGGYGEIDASKLPEGMSLDKEAYTEAQTKLHGLGLNKSQFDGVIGLYLEQMGGQLDNYNQGIQTGRAEAETALKGEWGDDFAAKVNLAQSVLATFGGDDMVAHVEKLGIGNDPNMLKLFAAIGDSLLDDSAGGSGDGTLHLQDAAAAKQEINTLKGNADFMKQLSDERHAQHAVAVKRWEGLHQAAFPVNTAQAV